MRARSWLVAGPGWALLVGALLAACLPGASASGLPGAALPLLATVVAVAVLAVVAALCRPGGLGPAAGASVGNAFFEPRCSARQCDPDASGHVRPRAPGSLVSPCSPR